MTQKHIKICLTPLQTREIEIKIAIKTIHTLDKKNKIKYL